MSQTLGTSTQATITLKIIAQMVLQLDQRNRNSYADDHQAERFDLEITTKQRPTIDGPEMYACLRPYTSKTDTHVLGDRSVRLSLAATIIPPEDNTLFYNADYVEKTGQGSDESFTGMTSIFATGVSLWNKVDRNAAPVDEFARSAAGHLLDFIMTEGEAFEKETRETESES